MLLSQLRIQSPGRRASRVRARAPASAGAAAGDSRWLAHYSREIRRKGRCSTARVMGRGAADLRAPRSHHLQGWAKKNREDVYDQKAMAIIGLYCSHNPYLDRCCRGSDRKLQPGDASPPGKPRTRQLDAVPTDL